MAQTSRDGKRQRGGAAAAPGVLAAVCVAALLCALVGCRRQKAPEAVRAENYAKDLVAVRSLAVKFDKPLALDDAVRYALEHNLDSAVANQDELIKLESRTGSRLKLLPSLNLASENTTRSDYDASRSHTMGGSTSSSPSYSSDKRGETFNVAVAWSVLDFGIAYYRAMQAGQEAQIAAQRLRRLRQNLAMQVSDNYWKAQVAREAMASAESLVKQLEQRAADVRKQLADGAINRSESLEEEAKVIEAGLRLRGYEKDYRNALAQLAALLGLPAGSDFELRKEEFAPLKAEPPLNIERLEEIALNHRPELYEFDMQAKISAYETRIAAASMFPNAQLFARKEHDGNKYLYTHDWYSAGINASMDLMSLPQKLSRKRAARLQEETERLRRLALSVGVMAQVRLAEIEYADATEEYGLVRSLFEKRDELAREYAKGEKEGTVKGDKVREAERAAHESRVKMLESYARVMAARERVRNTVGREPLAELEDGRERTPETAPAKAEKPPVSASVPRPDFDADTATLALGMQKEAAERQARAIAALRLERERQAAEARAAGKAAVGNPELPAAAAVARKPAATTNVMIAPGSDLNADEPSWLAAKTSGKSAVATAIEVTPQTPQAPAVESPAVTARQTRDEQELPTLEQAAAQNAAAVRKAAAEREERIAATESGASAAYNNETSKSETASRKAKGGTMAVPGVEDNHPPLPVLPAEAETKTAVVTEREARTNTDVNIVKSERETAGVGVSAAYNNETSKSELASRKSKGGTMAVPGVEDNHPPLPVLPAEAETKTAAVGTVKNSGTAAAAEIAAWKSASPRQPGGRTTGVPGVAVEPEAWKSAPATKETPVLPEIPALPAELAGTSKTAAPALTAGEVGVEPAGTAERSENTETAVAPEPAPDAETANAETEESRAETAPNAFDATANATESGAGDVLPPGVAEEAPAKSEAKVAAEAARLVVPVPEVPGLTSASTTTAPKVQQAAACTTTASASTRGKTTPPGIDDEATEKMLPKGDEKRAQKQYAAPVTPDEFTDNSSLNGLQPGS